MAVTMVSRLPRRLTPARLAGTASVRQRPAAVPIRVAAAPLGSMVISVRERLSFSHRALISLLLVGAMIAIIGPGSLASFNASTSPSSSITTALLVLNSLSNGNAATQCVSAGLGGSVPAANSASCTSFDLGASPNLVLPNQSIGAVQTQLRNVGNITPATLTLGGAAPTCPSTCASSTGSNCINYAVSGQPYSGGGKICSQIEVYIQEYQDSAYTTNYKCVYGAGSGATACTGFDSAHTLDDLGINHQAGSGGVISVPVYNSDATTLLKPGGNAYFKIFLSFPSSAFAAGTANTFQGQTGDLNFVWVANQ